ncbi:histone chaperone Rttp106-like-domain-containing protein [Lipomyces oligophaga]|uniref:histone chaperone Rttp106-like-domain-containing protein n=1 Tax=Lipomyces oligophaga TaxID=45792 RepID=UPI0034CFAFAC
MPLENASFLEALSADQDLLAEVATYTSKHPDSQPLFERVINHCTSSSTAKKRKLTSNLRHDASIKLSVPSVYFPSLSFSSPQRKKFALAFYKNALAVFSAGTPVSELATSEPVLIGHNRDSPGFLLIETPGKATVSYTLVYLLSSSTAATSSASYPDTIVAVLPESSAEIQGASVPDSKMFSPPSFLTSFLKSIPSLTPIISPLTESQTVVVEAHRGTKDGYLYLTPNGVFFGFKKPIWYAQLASIVAVTYSSITRMTFSLSVTTTTAATTATIADTGTAQEEEVEFSIIDQSHFSKIDEYVRLNQLSDRSMTESRRAKTELKLKPKTSDSGQDHNGHTVDSSELAKAHQEWAERHAGDEFTVPQSAVAENLNNPEGDADEDDEDDEDFQSDSVDDGGSPSSSEDEEDETAI